MDEGPRVPGPLPPLAVLGWRAWEQELGANPIELVTHATGDWALRFLLITLAVTPQQDIEHAAARSM
jgi:DMSO/TMAO reductase YedYZ heme-binding membrane subunit